MTTTVNNSQQQGYNPILLGSGGAAIGAGTGALAGKFLTPKLNEDTFVKKYKEVGKQDFDEISKLMDKAIAEGNVSENIQRKLNKLGDNMGLGDILKDKTSEQLKEYKEILKNFYDEGSDAAAKELFKDKRKNLSTYDQVINYVKKGNMKKYALIGGSILAALGIGMALFSGSEKTENS